MRLCLCGYVGESLTDQDAFVCQSACERALKTTHIHKHRHTEMVINGLLTAPQSKRRTQRKWWESHFCGYTVMSITRQHLCVCVCVYVIIVCLIRLMTVMQLLKNPEEGMRQKNQYEGTRVTGRKKVRQKTSWEKSRREEWRDRQAGGLRVGNRQRSDFCAHCWGTNSINPVKFNIEKTKRCTLAGVCEGAMIAVSSETFTHRGGRRLLGSLWASWPWNTFFFITAVQWLTIKIHEAPARLFSSAPFIFIFNSNHIYWMALQQRELLVNQQQHLISHAWAEP